MALAAALLPAAKLRQTRGERVLPDLITIHRELRRKGVTLQLLWEEYVQSPPKHLLAGYWSNPTRLGDCHMRSTRHQLSFIQDAYGRYW